MLLNSSNGNGFPQGGPLTVVIESNRMRGRIEYGDRTRETKEMRQKG